MEKERPVIKENLLASFKKEMAKIAEEETAAGRAHFDDKFNPDELTEEDRKMFTAFGNGTLEVNELRAKGSNLDQTLNESQKELIAYIANKMQAQVLLRPKKN